MRLFAVVVAALLTLPAQAAPLLIDFEGDPPGAPQNFTLHGMRFSPLCGVHLDNFPVGRYASVDPVNDCDSATNPDFFGKHAGGLLYIDRAGESFSLLSLEAKNDELPFLWSVASSKGGVFESSLIFATIPFVGDLWTDVQWITFSLGNIDECFHHDCGWDNLRFDVQAVDEPAPLTLIGLALAGLDFIRRRAPIIA